MADYGSAYQALIDKYNKDKANADALMPSAQDQQGVRDQQSLAALVSNLMKAQASVGSINGKATVNPDINYSATADINAKGLQDKQMQSQIAQKNAMQGLELGRQQQSDLMGANKFNQDFSQQDKMNPLNLQGKQNDLLLQKQQILQGGRNPLEVDKDLANLQRIQKIRETSKLISPSDPQKADELNKTADMLESKYSLKNISPGQKSADSSFGKDYADYIKAGGSADVDKSLAALQSAHDALASGKASTGPLQGFLSEHAPSIRNATSPDSVIAQQNVERAATGSVKQLLGSRLTQMEFAKVISQAYNPGLPKEENMARIKAMMDDIKAKKDSMESAGKAFESNNGSLKGYQATGQSKASKPKTVIQNGHTYNLNESTGQYE